MVPIKYHPRIAKVLLDKDKASEIENYYKKCAEDGATYDDIEASKRAMSSMEVILGEPSRLERLAVDIHDHYVSACDQDPDRTQKAMVVCSSRAIAYALLLKFKNKYPEWFEEKKVPDGVYASEEELKKLKPMPFMAMVSSVGSNDEPEMYNYLGGVKNDKRSEELDASFKRCLKRLLQTIMKDVSILLLKKLEQHRNRHLKILLIDKQADLNDVEYLWRKRFGIDLPALERMMIYLKNPDLWDCSPGSFDEKMYYRFSPEFTIETVMDDSKNGYQYYLFNQTDIHPRWYDINLYYHQTMLASLEGVSLDGGRYFTPSPRTDGISLTQYHNWDVAFKYYIKNSIEYIVHEFYYHPDGDDETIAHNRFMKCILVFECDSEKENFKEYLNSRQSVSPEAAGLR